jgi:hypothetical protein
MVYFAAMNNRVAWWVSFAGLAVTSMAFAGENVAVSAMGTKWTSPVTGIAAENSTRVLTGGVRHALAGIMIQESWDNPNFIQLSFTQLKRDDPEPFKKHMSISGNYESTNDQKEVQLPANHFASSLQICTNDNGDKAEIKGVAIEYADEIDAAGNTTRRKVSKRVESANCKKWLPRLDCPAGSVATEVTGYHDGKRYQGLKMVCYALKK